MAQCGSELGQAKELIQAIDQRQYGVGGIVRESGPELRQVGVVEICYDFRAILVIG